MATKPTPEFWEDFWQDFDEDGDKIKDIEGLIFQDKNGRWFTVITLPNSYEVLKIQVYHNPFTGEELPRD